MNQLIKVSVGVLVLAMGQVSFAGESSWAESKKAPNVYSPGIDNSTFHAAPSSTPRNARITGVEWRIGRYPNGASRQIFEICYAAWPTVNYTHCEDITHQRAGYSHAFNGYGGKGRFKITGNLSKDGKYPAHSSHYNDIKVHYEY